MGLDMSSSLPFLSGLICMGYIVAALFFARFWRRTGDDLFAAFSAAFMLLAMNTALVVILDVPREEVGWIYLLRLAAFTLIIVAIVRKNWRGSER